MSARLSNTDVEQQYTQLVRQANEFVDTDNWTLVPGSEDETGGREPWTVSDNSAHPVVLLGYTRRDAMNALVNMNAIMRALITGYSGS